MSSERVQVIINGKTIYDKDCSHNEIAFLNRDGCIELIAGPGTFWRTLSGLT